jgi:hypothetical protein
MTCIRLAGLCCFMCKQAEQACTNHSCQLYGCQLYGCTESELPVAAMAASCCHVTSRHEHAGCMLSKECLNWLLWPPQLCFHTLAVQVTLLSSGRLMYHGPCQMITPWFESLGYKLTSGEMQAGLISWGRPYVVAKPEWCAVDSGHPGSSWVTAAVHEADDSAERHAAMLTSDKLSLSHRLR